MYQHNIERVPTFVQIPHPSIDACENLSVYDQKLFLGLAHVYTIFSLYVYYLL